MKKIIIRVLIGFGVLIVVALLVVFFSLDSIVKAGVERVGPMITKVDVKLGSAQISPFGGSARLTKLFVGNPEGFKSPSAMQVGDIKVGAQMGSLMSQTIVINDINIQNADITLEGGLENNNLTKIMDNVDGSSAEAGNQPKPKNAPPQPGASKSSKKFIVKDFVMDGTKIHLDVKISALGKTVAVPNTTLPMPPLHIQNIGVKENGVTAEQLTQAIMKPLLASVIQASSQEVAHLGSNVGGELKNLGGSNTVNKVEKSIGNLFNKH
ncbi:MAG TPA: hypothetical protein VFB72_15140 [Verrucomicrobiae bacterium]|nr:hypothetical protein [Verrucomicrobiae bacterium]